MNDGGAVDAHDGEPEVARLEEGANGAYLATVTLLASIGDAARAVRKSVARAKASAPIVC